MSTSSPGRRPPASGRRPGAVLAGGLLALGLFAAGCGGRSGTAAPAASTGGAAAGAALRGLVPKPLPAKPSFTLTDDRGRRFGFAQATRGKLVYLYFGYTHCPDACPLTMSDIAAALRRQAPATRGKIEVVFVTVDPARDTPAVLRRWLRRYDASFVGLTGTLSRIRAAERAAGAPLAAPEKPAGAAYAVQHSTLVFAYSPDGRAHVVYADGFTARDYAHDMPILVGFASG
ncbi:MAG TPA: SCO family protein [Gaiellaceae bacterium]|nr:SCO family protein [Gaiellaceae bacterium]